MINLETNLFLAVMADKDPPSPMCEEVSFSHRRLRVKPAMTAGSDV